MFALLDRLLASFPQQDAAVVAGGAVVDLVLGQHPRNVDLFTWDADAASQVALRWGLRAVEAPSQLGEGYCPPVVPVRRVFRGRVDGVPVDLVLVTRDSGWSSLEDYVQVYFDLDIKMALYDGRVRLLPPAQAALESGEVGVVNWATPLSTAIRLWDAVQRYRLRPGAGFDALLVYFKACWEKDPDRLVRAKLGAKYHDRLEEFLSFLQTRPVSGSVETIQLVDLAAALPRLNLPRRARQYLAAAMPRWLAGELYADNLDTEERRFASEVCNLTMERDGVFSAARQQAEGQLLSRLRSLLALLPQRLGPETTVCGLPLGLLADSLAIDTETLRSGKLSLSVHGRVRVVRLGHFLRLLAALARGKGCEIEARDVERALEEWACLGPARSGHVRLRVSQRVADMLSITRGRAWSSCMDWALGNFSTLALSLLANLDGRSAVAILEDEHGDWLARALLRLDARNRTIWHERIYSVNEEARELLRAFLFAQAVLNDIRLGAVSQDTVLPPFPLPPYSDVLCVQQTEEGCFLLQPQLVVWG